MTPPLSIEFVNMALQKQWDKVFQMDLSTRSENGIQYAAAVIYADYLGIRVIGVIPPWVRRLRHYPKNVPLTLREGVAEILEEQGILLTDEGELVHIRRDE